MARITIGRFFDYEKRRAWASRKSWICPHRYPFLMVDKVENYEISDERKTLRHQERLVQRAIFQGHFRQAGLPGVLILKPWPRPPVSWPSPWWASRHPTSFYYFASIDNARFKAPGGPGDQLVLDVEF